MRRVLKKPGQLGKTNWDAVIRVYDEAGNVIETHEHKAGRDFSCNTITLTTAHFSLYKRFLDHPEDMVYRSGNRIASGVQANRRMLSCRLS